MRKDVHPECSPESPFPFDDWTWRDDMRDGEHFRRCSFCGSINPEDLAAEAGYWRAEWADRKYGWPHKFYVQIPNREPDRLFLMGTTNSAESNGPSWLLVDGLTEEQRAIVGDHDLTRVTQVLFGTRPYHHAKFYTTHLQDETIAPESLLRIQTVSNVVFNFSGGLVSWKPAQL